jgi:hypothetical protein
MWKAIIIMMGGNVAESCPPIKMIARARGP